MVLLVVQEAPKDARTKFDELPHEFWNQMTSWNIVGMHCSGVLFEKTEVHTIVLAFVHLLAYLLQVDLPDFANHR